MISTVSHYNQYGCNLSKISPCTSSNIIKCSRHNNDILIAVGNQIKILKTDVSNDQISDPSSQFKVVHSDLKIQRIISVTISNDCKFIGIIAEFPSIKTDSPEPNKTGCSTETDDKMVLLSKKISISPDVFSSTLSLLSKLNKPEVKCVICSFKKATDKTLISPPLCSNNAVTVSTLDEEHLYNFLSVSFSSCNTYVAILVNTVHTACLAQNVGALVYDRKSGLLKYSVPMTDISFLLFCPKVPNVGGSNVTRFCTVKTSSRDNSSINLPIIKIWRIASKELQCIDVIGIKSVAKQLDADGKNVDKRFNLHVTALSWLNNECIIIGSSNGKLLLINGNQVQNVVYDIYNPSMPLNESFSQKVDVELNATAASDDFVMKIGDNAMNSGREDHFAVFKTNGVAVKHILKSNEIVIAVSSCNKLAIFDFHISTKNVNSINKFELRKLYQVELIHVSIIYGAVLGISNNEAGNVNLGIDGSSVLSTASTSVSINDDNKKPTNCYHVILSTDQSLGHLYIPAEPKPIIDPGDSAQHPLNPSTQEPRNSYPGVLSSPYPQKLSKVIDGTADNPSNHLVESPHSEKSSIMNGDVSPRFNFMEKLNLLSNIAAGNDFDLVTGTTIRRQLDVHFFHYHSSEVLGMATARRTSAFLTVGGDGMLKLWDYNPYKKVTETSTHGHKSMIQPSLLSYNFYEDHHIVPTTMDLHPTGNYCVVGFADGVYEYAITDSKFEHIRTVSVKKPIIVNGQPFNNTSPVSIVKYSASGHLLAVATGRTVQVYNLSMNQNTPTDPSGSCKCLMVISDHKATVSDIVFTYDDSCLYTCSLDGYIFCYSLSEMKRVGDHFMHKRMSTMIMCISPLKLLCSAYTSANQNNSNNNGHASARVQVATDQYSARSRPNTVSYAPFASQNSTPKLSVSEIDNHNSAKASGHVSITPEALVVNSYLSLYSHYVTIWENGDFSNEATFHTEHEVTAIAICKQVSAVSFSNKDTIIVLGMKNGCVLMSKLPVTSSAREVVPLLNILTDDSFISSLPAAMRQPLRSLTAAAATSKSLASTRKSFRGLTPLVSTNHSSFKAESMSARTSSVPETPGRGRLHQAVSDEIAAFSSDAAQYIPMLLEQLPKTTSFLDTDPRSVSCVTLSFHSEEITALSTSEAGDFILASSADGSISIYSTLQFQPSFSDSISHHSNSDLVSEHSLVLTNRYGLSHMKQQIHDMEFTMLMATQECEGKIMKANRMINDLLLKRQEEYVFQTKKLKDRFEQDNEAIKSEFDLYRRTADDTIQKLNKKLQEQEQKYESKLYSQSNAIELFKQAYSEASAIHRLKSSEEINSLKSSEVGLKQAIDKRISEIERQKELTSEETAKLKNGMVEEVEKINAVHKQEIDTLNKTIQQLTATSNESQAKLEADVKKLTKDAGFLKLFVKKKTDEWGDITSKSTSKYENLLLEYRTLQVEVRTEKESRAKLEAELTEFLKEYKRMQKMNKYLNVQLEDLQGDVRPKEIKLEKTVTKLSDLSDSYDELVVKLKDVTRENDLLSDKVAFFRKNLYELRYILSHKVNSFKRLAKAYKDYEKTCNMHLTPTALTINDEDSVSAQVSLMSTFGRNIENMVRKKDSEGLSRLVSLLAKLDDILQPYISSITAADIHYDKVALNEEESALMERERHMTLLHKSLEGVKDNLKLTHAITGKKMRNQIKDNMELLAEVESLREENQKLSSEKDVLENILKFKNLRKSIIQSRLSVSAEHNSNNISDFGRNYVTGTFEVVRNKDEVFSSGSIVNSGVKTLSPLKRSGLSASSDQQKSSQPLLIDAKSSQKAERKDYVKDLAISSDDDGDIESPIVAEGADITDSKEFINFVKGLAIHSRPQSQENKLQQPENLSHSSSFLTGDIAPNFSQQLLNDTKNTHITFPYIKTSSSAPQLPTSGELSLQGSQVAMLKKTKVFRAKCSQSQITDSSTVYHINENASHMSDSENEEEL